MKSDRQFGVSLLLLLAYVACCDSELSDGELSSIRRTIAGTPEASLADEVIAIAREADVASIQCACEIVRMNRVPERSETLMSLLLSVAIADGYLRPSENVVLRFLADVLSISPKRLDELFHEATGKPFPPIPDPGSASWWEARQARTNPNGSSSGQAPGPASTPNLERLRALAMLGLDDTATEADIKSAFRRLAQVHHPDRFHTLGAEATSAAAESFRRIKTAHDYLTTRA